MYERIIGKERLDLSRIVEEIVQTTKSVLPSLVPGAIAGLLALPSPT